VKKDVSCKQQDVLLQQMLVENGVNMKMAPNQSKFQKVLYFRADVIPLGFWTVYRPYKYFRI